MLLSQWGCTEPFGIFIVAYLVLLLREFDGEGPERFSLLFCAYWDAVSSVLFRALPLALAELGKLQVFIVIRSDSGVDLNLIQLNIA